MIWLAAHKLAVYKTRVTCDYVCVKKMLMCVQAFVCVCICVFVHALMCECMH